MKEPNSEIFSPNAWYGFARIFKRYAKWPFCLPFVIPHGVELSKDFLWKNEIENDLPGIWAFPKHRTKAYKKAASNKVVLSGCSPWLFILDLIKNKNPRHGTVAFPPHSTHHVTAKFDDSKYADRLKQSEKENGAITICMFWRDIELGRSKIYENRGFPVISAGHMFNEKFAEQLLNIFYSFEFMHTTEIGSHLYYASAAGCKVILKKNREIVYVGSKKILKRDFSHVPSLEEKQIIKIFSSDNYKAQKQISLRLLGAQYMPTPFQAFMVILKTSLIKQFLFKKALPHYFRNLFA